MHSIREYIINQIETVELLDIARKYWDMNRHLSYLYIE